MTTIITDKHLERSLHRRRKKAGADRWDEVWEGVYIVSPLPNVQHQELVGTVYAILAGAIAYGGRGRVFPGVNVSDQPKRWQRNYRCPDVAVYLETTSAEDRGTHWFGGPDLAVEIVSPGENPHAKLDFYAKVETRELLVIDRDPWRMELFRLTGGELASVGVSEITGEQPGTTLASETVPFTWRLVPGRDRPKIEMTGIESGQAWHV